MPDYKAKKIKDNIVKEIVKLKNKRPKLAIIAFQKIPESQEYIQRLEKEAKKVGIDTHTYFCDGSTENEALAMIDFLNNDEMIDAIFVKRPIIGFDEIKIISAIDPNKALQPEISEDGEDMETAFLFKRCLEKLN